MRRMSDVESLAIVGHCWIIFSILCVLRVLCGEKSFFNLEPYLSYEAADADRVAILMDVPAGVKRWVFDFDRELVGIVQQFCDVESAKKRVGRNFAENRAIQLDTCSGSRRRNEKPHLLTGAQAGRLVKRAPILDVTKKVGPECLRPVGRHVRPF